MMTRNSLVLVFLLALTTLAVSTGTRCGQGKTRASRPVGNTVGSCKAIYKGFPKYPPRKMVEFIEKYFKTLSDCDIPAHTALLAPDFESFEADGDVLTVERQRGALEGFCQRYDAKFEVTRMAYVSPRVVYLVVRLSDKLFKNGGFTYSQSMTLVPCGDSYVLGQDVQSTFSYSTFQHNPLTFVEYSVERVASYVRGDHPFQYGCLISWLLRQAPSRLRNG